MLLTVPEEEIDVFVATNSPSPVRTGVLALVEALLGDRLQSAPPPPRADDHAALRGRYRSEDGGTFVDFGAADGRLTYAAFGSAGPPLVGEVPREHYWPFAVPGYAASTRFMPGPDRDMFDRVDPGFRQRFRRLAPATAALDDVLRGADSAFESAEAGATLSFARERDAVRVHTRGEYGRCEFVARVIAPDAFHITPVGHDAGWLARLERGANRVEAVVLSSARTRALRFVRRTGAA
jgi:hypothetical protein